MLPAPQRPVDAAYAVNEVTHQWQVSTFDHLARCKQLLLDYAVSEGFTHVMLVDSDLLLEHSTLQSLYACNVDIVSGVFWTAWQPGTPPLPQTWLAHPYVLEGLGMQQHEYLSALDNHALVRVLGGGACCLIKTSVLNKVRYSPRLALPEGGMWQGEDRTLAVLAQQRHVKQYADAWPRIYHAYRPADRTPEQLALVWQELSAPKQIYAKLGDMVSIRLTPLEDPPLQDAIDPSIANTRVRLGSGKLCNELEHALQDMHLGSSKVVDIAINAGHPVYPPGKRAILVELIDARPY